MLRLTPPGYLRFFQNDTLETAFGGGEANVAVSLAGFGVDAAFVTKLPDNDIGTAAIAELRKYGVDVSFIARGGERMGIYFLEKGASQRPSKVIYDRKYSSVSEAVVSDFNFDAIFNGAEFFHFTGITPALSDAAAELTLIAVKKAKGKGLTVSCDLNYRKSLWTTKKANEIMRTLMPFVDILIANEEDAEKIFGIGAESSESDRGRISREGYTGVAKKLITEFGFKKVGITLRESISASDNIWSAMICNGGECYFSRKYPIHIVDRIGGGDAFASGLIYGILAGMSDSDMVEFAAAASCLKHSIEGDFNRVSVAEVNNLLSCGGSGRVQR